MRDKNGHGELFAHCVGGAQKTILGDVHRLSFGFQNGVLETAAGWRSGPRSVSLSVSCVSLCALLACTLR